MTPELKEKTRAGAYNCLAEALMVSPKRSLWSPAARSCGEFLHDLLDETRRKTDVGSRVKTVSSMPVDDIQRVKEIVGNLLFGGAR
jgi:hypothetical protein